MRLKQILLRLQLRKADQAGAGDLQKVEQRPRMVSDPAKKHPDPAHSRAQIECGKSGAIKKKAGEDQGQKNGPDDEQVAR